MLFACVAALTFSGVAVAAEKAVSGTIDPAGQHGGPVIITNSSPSAKFSVDWPTIPEVLEDASVSWKVYKSDVPAAAILDVMLEAIDEPAFITICPAALPSASA